MVWGHFIFKENSNVHAWLVEFRHGDKQTVSVLVGATSARY